MAKVQAARSVLTDEGAREPSCERLVRLVSMGSGDARFRVFKMGLEVMKTVLRCILVRVEKSRCGTGREFGLCAAPFVRRVNLIGRCVRVDCGDTCTKVATHPLKGCNKSASV